MSVLRRLVLYKRMLSVVTHSSIIARFHVRSFLRSCRSLPSKPHFEIAVSYRKTEIVFEDRMELPPSGVAASSSNTRLTSLKGQLDSIIPIVEDLRSKKGERIKKVTELKLEIENITAELDGHNIQSNSNKVDEDDLSIRKMKDYQAQLCTLQKEKSERLRKVFEYVNEVRTLCSVLGNDFGITLKEVHSSLHESCNKNSTNISDSTLEGLSQIESEVDRLTKLKASKLKELVLKKRLDLEEVCGQAHIEPDLSTSPDKLCALIDSGLVDPSELLANIDCQIAKANEESYIRKDIIERINKWEAACAEERWLEEYNQDENRYCAGRGAHLNLKHAEKARVTATKIPGLVDTLISKALSWEKERIMHFFYDGVRLISLLEDYKIARQQKEQDKKRSRDQKKLQQILLTEKEALYGSKSSPKRSNTFRKLSGCHSYGNGNGFMTPAPRRVSVCGATSELLTPRSYSGRQNGYFKEMRRLSTAPLNFVSIPKEDALSSFATISCLDPGSPPRG